MKNILSRKKTLQCNIRVEKAELDIKQRQHDHKFFKNVYLLMLRESVHEQERGRERQRGRERILSRLHAVSTESNVGLSPTNCAIIT